VNTAEERKRKSPSFSTENTGSSLGAGWLKIARTLLAIAFPGECFFGTALLSWLQIERVTLDFLYDVFLLNLALKPAQRAFESFAILEMDFCQTKFTTFRLIPPLL
jgi:hypothetical protein